MYLNTFHFFWIVTLWLNLLCFISNCVSVSQLPTVKDSKPGPCLEPLVEVCVARCIATLLQASWGQKGIFVHAKCICCIAPFSSTVTLHKSAILFMKSSVVQCVWPCCLTVLDVISQFCHSLFLLLCISLNTINLLLFIVILPLLNDPISVAFHSVWPIFSL